MVKRLVFVAIVLFAMFVGYLWAQTAPIPSPPSGFISGNDIGFRLDRALPGRAIGKLMVRIDGKWLDAEVSTNGRVVPVQNK
jgi:hypothetical protein